MPWEEQQIKASEAGYKGSVVSYFNDLLADVQRKELADVRIPVSNGLLQVKKPVLKSVTCELTFTPSEEQLFSAYSEVPSNLLSLTSRGYRKTDAFLYIQRSIPNGEEPPIRFKQEIVPNNDNFKVVPLLPESLTKGKVTEYDGFPTHESIDDVKHEIAKKIVKELRREGHPISVRQFECVKQACVSPRETNHDGLLEVMKKGEEVDFYAKDYESNYRREKKDSAYLHGVAWMEARPNKMKLGTLGSREDAWRMHEVMCDLIKAMDLKVEPDSIVTLNKPVERLYSRIVGAVADGLLAGLGGVKRAIVNPPQYAYRKLVQEPKRKKWEVERQAVLETLKEGQIAQGLASSCLIQVDKECMLKRAKKIKQEKPEEKN